MPNFSLERVTSDFLNWVVKYRACPLNYGSNISRLSCRGRSFLGTHFVTCLCQTLFISPCRVRANTHFDFHSPQTDRWRWHGTYARDICKRESISNFEFHRGARRTLDRWANEENLFANNNNDHIASSSVRHMVFTGGCINLNAYWARCVVCFSAIAIWAYED